MGALNEEPRALDVAPDTIFEVLSDRRRRAVLSVLRDSPDATLPVQEVLDHVAAEMAEAERRERDQKRVAAWFHHATLPKLADSGLIERDSEDGTVRYRPNPLADACLDLVAGDTAGNGDELNRG